MRRCPRQNAEDGLTLIEVIVALFLIGMVATGSLYFFMQSVQKSADLQRTQAAVTLANNAMDRARAVSAGAVNVTGTSGLVKGRSQSAVQTVWNEATSANAADTADMTIAWDSEGGLTTASQWVPIRETTRLDNQDYTIDTLIGTCYRQRAASTTATDCFAANPEPGTDAYIVIYRVRVVVTWDGGTAGKQGSYRVTTLVDPSADAVWNTVLKPFAYDDEVSISAGDPPTFFAIVANDQVEYDAGGSTSPIVGLTQPSLGSVAIRPSEGINGVVFTPPGDTSISGTVTFTYRVKAIGGSQETSVDAATVTVHILPKPLNDATGVVPGSTTDLTATMLANDLGLTNHDPARKTTIVLAANKTVDLFSPVEEMSAEMAAARTASQQALAERGVSIDGAGNVWFAAPTEETGVPIVFYYYLVDDSDEPDAARYPSVQPARVELMVGSCFNIADHTIDILATAGGTVLTDLKINELNGNDPNCQVQLTDIIYTYGQKGQITVDGQHYNAADRNTGSVISFQPQDNSPYLFQIEYVMWNQGKTISNGVTKVLTIRVVPVANDDVYENVARSSEMDLQLKNNDAPTDSTSKIVVVDGLTNCPGGSFTTLDNDFVKFKAPPTASVCTFTYKLVANGYPDIESSVATVTINVVE